MSEVAFHTSRAARAPRRPAEPKDLMPRPPEPPERAENAQEAVAALRAEERADPGRTRPPVDPALAGPPPAFQANLLELSQDIETLLRDIRLARDAARQGYGQLGATGPSRDS